MHWQIDCLSDWFGDGVVMFLAMSMETMVKDGTNCRNDERYLLGIRLANSELRLGYLRVSSLSLLVTLTVAIETQLLGIFFIFCF